MRRKYRTDVHVVTISKDFAEHRDIRRQFRAAVHVVVLTNYFAERIALRRKFKAAVNLLIISDRLVDRPLQGAFTLLDFQDTVNIVVAVNQLDRLVVPTKAAIKHRALQKLSNAANMVLHGDNQKLPEVTVLHGKLVHENQRRNFLTTWKFVEDEVPGVADE
jgi:hypothetical protein